MSCITFPAGREDKAAPRGQEQNEKGGCWVRWWPEGLAAHVTAPQPHRWVCYTVQPLEKCSSVMWQGRKTRGGSTSPQQRKWDDRTLSSALLEHIFDAFQVLQMWEWILSPPQQVISIPKDGRKSPFKIFLVKNVYREFSLETEVEALPFFMMNDLLDTKHVKGFK